MNMDEIKEYLLERPRTGKLATLKKMEVRRYLLYGLIWMKMGFSKGALHYMKKNTEADKLFSLNIHLKEKLEMWQQT